MDWGVTRESLRRKNHLEGALSLLTALHKLLKDLHTVLGPVLERLEDTIFRLRDELRRKNLEALLQFELESAIESGGTDNEIQPLSSSSNLP